MAPRSRQEAVRTERRARDPGTLDRMKRNKLALPAAFRDDPHHTYRWINDDNTRIHDMTVEGDWDICSLPGADTQEGEQVRKPVGQKDNGDPLYAYLCREPKKFYDEDQAAKTEAINVGESAALKGQQPNSAPDPTQYAPAGNTVKRGYSP